MKVPRIRKEQGITLIALLITIVVLMVLAAVAITSIKNDGIIGHAENATDKFKQEQVKEQDMLEYYEGLLSGTLKYVKDVQEVVFTENTNVYDEYGNKIVVPAGFMITKDADTVPEGIVIQDATYTNTIGSQFVWIPVGNVKSSKGTKTIALSRYTFASDGKPTAQGDKAIDTYYKEIATSTQGNEVARDIEAFITSANSKGGYYIGRYEARKNSETVTTVTTNTVWLTGQPAASNKSKAMYGDAKETKGTFSSDLINSYAWDTAIVFLQEFDNRTGDDLTPYSQQTSLNASLSETGTKTDVICNVYDMASNCSEWTTESYCNGYWSGSTAPACVERGGHFERGGTTARRDTNTPYGDVWKISFRPILYVAL